MNKTIPIRRAMRLGESIHSVSASIHSWNRAFPPVCHTPRSLSNRGAAHTTAPPSSSRCAASSCR
jgi:hypothetical protein